MIESGIYRAMIESAMDAFFLTKADGTILDANAAACKLFGYTHEELLSAQRKQIIDTESPGLAEHLKVRQETGKVDCELIGIKKNGEKFPVRVSSVIFNEDGAEQKICIIIHDIAELKRREKELHDAEINMQMILNNTEELFIILDKELKIINFNKATEEKSKKILGVPLEKGKSIFDTADPQWFPYLKELYADVLTGSTRRSTVDIPVTTYHSKIIVDIHYAPLYEKEQIVGVFINIHDVTEEKEKEIALIKANERFYYVTKATNDAIWDWDLKQDKVVRVCDGLKNLFGYEIAEADLEKNFWTNRVHPDDLKMMLENRSHLLFHTKELYWEDQYRFRKSDGTYAYVFDKGCIIRDADGKPERMIGSTQNITERKLVELQVLNSERRFRSLLQNGSDMIKILDENGKFIFSSPNVEQVLGFPPTEIIGRKFHEFIHPDEVQYLNEHFETIKQSVYHQIQYFRFKNAVGEWRWLETKLTNLLDDPDVKGIVSNSRDVTEKKKSEETIRESEERYRNLFFNNPLSIYIWNIETFEILEVNNTATKEYGYSREEFLSLSMLALRKSEDIPKYLSFTNQLADAGSETVTQGVWKHVHKNGEPIFMEIYSQKIFFNGHNAVLALANNVTEKIRLETKLDEERNAKQKEITEAVIHVQEKERYEISRELHDNVNQQLTVAMMYIATAEKGTDSADALLQQSSGFIYNAIEEIRKLSKALVTPLIKDFGLCKAIDGLIEDIQLANSIHFDFFCDDFHEEDISYEFKLNIFRIIQEQTNNIIKHSEAKQVIIELYRNERIKLSIIDDGIGFDTSLKRNSIGLNNIQTRTELYTGSIKILSELGNGCKIKIEFPVTKDILIEMKKHL